MINTGLKVHFHNASVALILSLGSLAAVPAAAGVVYNWVEIHSNAYLGPVEGRLVFEDSIWNAGGHYHEQYGGGNGYQNIPGLESFYFAQSTDPGDFSVNYRSDRPSPYGTVTYTMDFYFGAVLTGAKIWFDNTHTTMHLQGNISPLWTVDIFQGDVGPCYSFQAQASCKGGTGIWVLDLKTVPVPEPQSLALVALALAALVIARRSKPNGPLK